MHLAVIQTHPIQYYAPVYLHLQQVLGVSTTAIYGCDAGVGGYRDAEFARQLSWDLDLTQGYGSVFLGRGAPEQARTRGLRQALADLQPDAVLLTGYSPRFHTLSALTAVRAGYPLMMRAETSDETHSRSAIKDAVRSAGLSTLYRRIGRFLYVGSNAREHYLRLRVPESKLVFSPMSVPGEHFRPMAQAAGSRARVCQELGLDESTTLVLFSGKFTRKKSPDHLLQAGAMLAPELRARMALVFMGDGPLHGALDDAARAAEQATEAAAVRVIGFRNQSELSDYYHACDLLALPSLYRETWGLVVNEALMHGKPCLVSDRVGCQRDLVEPGVTGEVHRHGDVQDLAAGLTRCIALARERGTRDRCLARVQRYSTAAAAEGIGNALEALLR